MKMRRNNILVDPMEKPKETRTGLLLTDAQGFNSYSGKVVEVGPDVLDIKPGDLVLYSEFAGSNLYIEDKKYLIIDADNIWGIA
jgi:chaperonin GroES